MKEISMSPREYQEAIFDTCKEKDCLVVLPTGTGKTLIALMLAVERFKKFPTRKKSLIPSSNPTPNRTTLRIIQKNLPEDWADMQLFTGKTPSEQKEKDMENRRIHFLNTTMHSKRPRQNAIQTRRSFLTSSR